MNINAFPPDSARGLAVDAAVRARLAGSIQCLADAAQGRMSLDMGKLRALAAAVAAHPVRPGVMVLYADAVEALVEARTAAAEDALAALAEPQWQEPAAPRIVTLDDHALGAGMAARYARHLQDEPGPGFAAIAPREIGGQSDRLHGARALLATVQPALLAEIDALTPEIVLVGSPGTPGGAVFHGASSFYVWGSLTLNAAEHKTRVDLVRGLAHEAGHGLLHGLTLGAPLVANDPVERYASPLRDDPRPMEGLVHAAYVLARMRLAMDTLARSDVVPAAEREEAAEYGRAAASAFADALATIDAHARFTPQGAVIFAGARRAMAGAGRPGQDRLAAHAAW